MDTLFDFLEAKFQKQVLAVIYDNGQYNGSLIEKKGSDLTIIESFDTRDSIIEVLQKKSHLPIILAIQDAGVLHYVENVSFDRDSAIHFFEEEVPNTDRSDFLICYHENVIAFGRQSLVSSIVSGLDSYASNVVKIALAPIFSIELAKILTTENQRPAVLNALFAFEGDQVMVSVNDEPTEATLDGIRYDNNSLASLAAALDYVGNSSQLVEQNRYDLRREQLIVEKVFAKAKIPVLLSLLILFLFNGISYFSLSRSNDELKERVGVLNVLDTKLKSLDTFIASHEQILLRSEQPETLAILADQIGASISNGIKLTRVVIHPEADERHSGKFERNLLLLEGTAQSTEVMTAWIKKLEQENWVKQIEKQHYEGTPVSKSGRFQLAIRLYVEES